MAHQANIFLHEFEGIGGEERNFCMSIEIDEFDRAIIAALRDNARLSNLELAGRIALSHSAISRRIKRLEEAGVIRGYRAVVDPSVVGESVRAFTTVQRLPHVSAMELAEAMRQVPGVISCWIVSGDSDLMIEIAAADMKSFSDLMLERLQTIPGVAATRSTFVLEAIKET